MFLTTKLFAFVKSRCIHRELVLHTPYYIICNIYYYIVYVLHTPRKDTLHEKIWKRKSEFKQKSSFLFHSAQANTDSMFLPMYPPLQQMGKPSSKALLRTSAMNCSRRQHDSYTFHFTCWGIYSDLQQMMLAWNLALVYLTTSITI